ncbi:uncharacterized protein LOC112590685 [Harpegnathos saltator]|uniref:uncharacterized protein LOC112590685 n=1 Tax=Harpegnathos saltator TaxID=610380 RepID=UPI000DBED609|nr:uncharacterized protein LOC112590685 [Harpegnathos saltator]
MFESSRHRVANIFPFTLYPCRVFHEILTTMDEDWKEYITTDSRVYPMVIYANLSRRYCNILMSINASAAIFYALGGFVRRSAKDEDNPRGTKFDFPVQMDFPFEVNESAIFEITAMVQFLHELSLSSLVAMINLLIVGELISCFANSYLTSVFRNVRAMEMGQLA